MALRSRTLPDVCRNIPTSAAKKAYNDLDKNPLEVGWGHDAE